MSRSTKLTLPFLSTASSASSSAPFLESYPCRLSVFSVCSPLGYWIPTTTTLTFLLSTAFTTTTTPSNPLQVTFSSFYYNQPPPNPLQVITATLYHKKAILKWGLAVLIMLSLTMQTGDLQLCIIPLIVEPFHGSVLHHLFCLFKKYGIPYFLPPVFLRFSKFSVNYLNQVLVQLDVAGNLEVG
ncbi:hypothetical protein E2C01_099009 [Portunus trituberculatus]|uniref:Uncharacterized protein n=1 Tax=Portunus trituberculatus TaxID=210409 RepID=A0A5B7K4D3_PORTR|nr:hypothetical protein [Portunus trituberculatus]